MVYISLPRNLFVSLLKVTLALLVRLLRFAQCFFCLSQLHFHIPKRVLQLSIFKLGQAQHLLVLVLSSLLGVDSQPFADLLLNLMGTQMAVFLSAYL
jgi:hypothetical protein